MTPARIRRFAGAMMMAGLLTTAWAGLGRAQAPKEPPPREGPAERAGEVLDRALNRLERGAERAGDALRQEFRQAKASVQSMGVEARIYGRLHWDKDLEDADFALDVDREGVARLSGAVRDAMAKAKAVRLAQETVGVTRVEDQLTIRSVGAAAPGGAAPAAAPERTPRP